MRLAFLVCVLLSAVNLGWCETVTDQSDSAAVLERVRNADAKAYSDLKSFVCDESILRYRSAFDGSRPHSIDTVTASLSFENGAEHYAAIKQDTQALAGISNLNGAWSEGEFGTLLRQTNQLLRVEAVSFDRMTTWDGQSALLYQFNVPAEDSPWDLVIDGATYRLPFRTEIWVNAATGQIVRIVRTASSLQRVPGVSEVQWSLNLRPVRMLDKEWLLPVTAQYSVAYAQTNRREWNQIEFRHYRRYGSEVALRFDQPLP